jgi:hypothetical protein
LTGCAGAIYHHMDDRRTTLSQLPSRIANVTDSSRDGEEQRQIVGFLGVGLDNRDGHQRLTRAEHFLLVGGSAETHERLQDTAIYFNEELKKRGKVLEETCPEEAIEILKRSLER